MNVFGIFVKEDLSFPNVLYNYLTYLCTVGQPSIFKSDDKVTLLHVLHSSTINLEGHWVYFVRLSCFVFADI